jgi:nicotinate-nucleotide pyrophosphorylase (carboxylating)
MRVDARTRKLVRMALQEDLGGEGDITTRNFLPKNARYRARFLFKEDGVLCGRAVVDEVFRQACPKARVAWLRKDGQAVRAGTVVARVRGPREILTAERTALNFLQRLSGIATLTRSYASRVRGTRARIYDTRKTIPGWRILCKAAVRAGGGRNHRMGLHDMVLLKDNHLDGWEPSSVLRRVARFRRKHPRVPIEVEARDLREVRTALELGADLVLLDNMSLPLLRRAVAHIRKASAKTLVEVSGGVDLAAVRGLARAGADRISVGRLTHSARALDISMKLEP